MRLVKLTSAGRDANHIYINPDHVVSVEQFKNYTLVITTAQAPDGGGARFSVAEGAEQVIEALQD